MSTPQKTGDEPAKEEEATKVPGHTYIDTEGLNSKLMRCTFCPSIILRTKIASLVDLEKSLPKILGKNDPEVIRKFWLVSDIFQFENMSFSNTVEQMKFLSCCDCDMGPIGYQDLESKLCYIATERVNYTDE